jgi:hypothetical protein
MGQKRVYLLRSIGFPTRGDLLDLERRRAPTSGFFAGCDASILEDPESEFFPMMTYPQSSVRMTILLTIFT